jgi:nicotinate-nucleotide--dimethylbenzimidazole phosphoribosyltransferase
MLANFVAGGAAVSVLARAQGAALEVVNLGTAADPGSLPGVINARIAPMTADFTQAPAMTEAQFAAALEAGRAAVQRAVQTGAELLIGGEMGIANTTAAAALACALLGEQPGALSGPGTGLNPSGVAHKAAVIGRALALHGPQLDSPLEALRRLGGFEIAALAGAAIACAQAGLPLLVDGFIVTAAVLAACRIQPGVRDWLLFAHRSAEPGHARLLAALDAAPLLALDMRLGEGSGALAALPLLRLACAVHAGMATFAEAGISGDIR